MSSTPAVADAVAGHEERGLVALLAQRVGGAADLAADLEQPAAAAQLGGRGPAWSATRSTPSASASSAGTSPTTTSFQASVQLRGFSRSDQVGPVLDAGHVNVPLMVAGDDPPNSGMRGRPSASAGPDELRSSGRWMAGSGRGPGEHRASGRSVAPSVGGGPVGSSGRVVRSARTATRARWGRAAAAGTRYDRGGTRALSDGAGHSIARGRRGPSRRRGGARAPSTCRRRQRVRRARGRHA